MKRFLLPIVCVLLLATTAEANGGFFARLFNPGLRFRNQVRFSSFRSPFRIQTSRFSLGLGNFNNFNVQRQLAFNNYLRQQQFAQQAFQQEALRRQLRQQQAFQIQRALANQQLHQRQNFNFGQLNFQQQYIPAQSQFNLNGLGLNAYGGGGLNLAVNTGGCSLF